MKRSTAMTAEAAPQEIRRSRGDRQRDAIVSAVRELLQERSFADLSVSTISERAGVARSGFYFYFDSKYAVLDRKSTRLNSSHQIISYAVFCLKKKKKRKIKPTNEMSI